MKIFLLIVVGTIMLLVVLLVIDFRFNRLIKQIWQDIQFESNEILFTKKMIADLDEPVRRYFLHAIAPGTS